MNRLRNLPIRRKLILVILLTCSVALVLALAALFVVQLITIKSDFIRDTAALGRVIAHNSAAAAAFNDHDAALQTLSAMKNRPDIEGACLVLSNGEHVTGFDLDHEHNAHAESEILEGYRTIAGDLLFASPVEIDGKRLGTLYLRADFSPIRERLLKFYGGTFAIVLVVSLLLAFILASRLQRFITAPILHLAGVAQGVGGKGDYSARATKAGNDEVGVLTDAFNEMLRQIQQRDERVEERTNELASSVSVLNATLESTADGILAVQFSGEVVCYNTQFAVMWGVPAEVLEKRQSEAVIAYCASQVSHSERYLAQFQEQKLSVSSDGFEVIELKNGRTFERYVKTQRVDGRPVGVVINFRDITERKRAEDDLAQTHGLLLGLSRQAGMAEIATSVLHNVGNVLNSVNISTGLIIASVKKSRGASLAKVVDLLQEHTQDLGEFVTNDPRGKHVPAHLAQIAKYLMADQEAIVGELNLLGQNVEHIKEIVAMQQNYATFGGVRENIDVVALVEDSLRMNEGSMSRHQVEVIREFKVVPVLNVEKHKILQILVNLLHNAKYACDDSDRRDKRLTVRVTEENNRVSISVIDNGVGILPENLDRIFNHGFTTRKSGHGFGLHSGALAATEMGGSLTAQSDGPGQGATFTLELPCQTQENSHE